MPYSVNNTDSSLKFTIQDGAVDNSTLSISLIGTNAENYADDIARNDVHLLENFAGASAPTAGTVLTGQLWYDKTDNVLRVYNGDTNGWVNLQPQVLTTAPIGTGERANKKGELYFDTSNNKFYIYDGASWKPTGYAGEETSELSGDSLVHNPTKFGAKVRAIFLKDTSGRAHPCMALVYVNNSTSNELYGTSTNGETIMAIFNHDATFTADNVISNSEGDSINYYAELNATGGIGVTINKGMNLRKDYVAEAVNLATEAITAQKANALFRAGQVVSAASIITDDISFIPTGAPGSLTLGSSSQYFDTLFAQRVKLGDGGQAEIETATDNLGILGSSEKAFADVFTYDLHANANVNVGEILSVTGNSNLTGNVDVTNHLQVNQNIRSNATVFGATLTDNTLQINSGSIGNAINGTFSGRITFGDLFDGSISITDFDSSVSLSSNSDNKLPTQRAVKTFVDTEIATLKSYVETQDKAQDLDFGGDSGTGAVIIGNATVDSASMTFTGGDGITTSALGTTLTTDVDNTVVRTSGAQTIAGVKTFSNDANFSQDVEISGNLNVTGTQTTVNTATLSIADNEITLNSDVTGTPSQNAGIEVERGSSTNVRLRWNESTDKWQFTNDGSTYSDITTYSNFSVTSNSASGNGALTYNNGNGTFTFTPADTSLATKSTTNLSEGTNLYYTNARADARIAAADLTDLSDVNYSSPQNGQALIWNGGNNRWESTSIPGGITEFVNLTDIHATGSTTGQVLQKLGNGDFGFGTVSSVNNYADSLAFNTSTGVLTVGRSGLSDLTVDLDGRYSTSDTVYSTATSSTAGILKIGYTENGKNYPLELNGSSQAFVNVPWTDTNTTYSQATSSTLGLVKIGFPESGKNYPIELNASGQAYVNVPWVDTNTNTTYTASGNGLQLSGTAFSHKPTSTITDFTASSRRYVTGLTFDEFGHVTGLTHGTESDQSFSDTNYYVNGMSFNTGNGVLTLTRNDGGTVTQDLDGRYSTTDTNTTYSTATSSTLGLVKIGYAESGQNYPVELSSGKMYVNVPWTNTNTTYTAGVGLQLVGTEFRNTVTNTDTITYISQGTGVTVSGPSSPGNSYQISIGQSVGTSDTVQFGLIRSTGDIVAYYSSDERLKDNVKPIENALEKLQKIRGVEFDWNDKQDVYEGHDTGVIAQEVQKVLPEVVTEREDGMLAVKYEKMIGLLIESIKDLKAEVDELKQQLGK